MENENILNMPPQNVLDEAQEKVRKYHEENKRMFKEIVDSGMAKGALAKELERLANGGVDYSLFNLMLQRIDFKDCATMMDAMRKMYESLWPFYSRTILENAFLRSVTGKIHVSGKDDSQEFHIEALSSTELVRLTEILQSDVDPNSIARKTLEEIKKAAQKRRELNLY